MLLTAALLLAAQGVAVPVVSHAEPRPASPWLEVVDAHCGDTHLQIVQYLRAWTDPGEVARVEVDGQPLRGDNTDALLNDLGRVGAAYRFQVMCLETGEVLVRVNVGRAGAEGETLYQAGSFAIAGGQLVLYNRLEPSDAHTFWFR